MSKSVRALVVVGIAVLAVSALMIWLRQSRKPGAAAQYMAQLRARGEKLSFEEWGFPAPPDTGGGMRQLEVAADKLGSVYPLSKLNVPGSLEWMHFAAPGKVTVLWASPSPLLAGVPPLPTWAEFEAQLDAAAGSLRDIREAVKTPARYVYFDPGNWTNRPLTPFVRMRTAAQWLAADALGALHAGQLERARDDLHALAQLAEFHKDDLTLVSQMIRVAIAGLGLNATWGALQAKGWTERDLAALQSDWEQWDALSAAETGFIGARAGVAPGVAWMRTTTVAQRQSVLGIGGNRSWEGYFFEGITLPLWRANSDADELYALQFHQTALDSFRRLRQGASWKDVKRGINAQVSSVEAKATNSVFVQVRYLFSLRSLPNCGRVAETIVRNETQRRLTVTAIALERCRQRQGTLPKDLAALVPDFLSSVPIDLMTGKPLRYQLKETGTFALYSVGDDGRDDGGDPNPSSVANRFDWWSGKDVVWPAAASGSNPSDR